MSASLRTWNLPVFTALGLLAACASAPKPLPPPVVDAPAGPVAEGPITPRFAWPEGLTAEVTYSSSRLRSGEPTESGESRYRMVVKGEGDALKLVSEDLKLADESAEALAARGPLNIPTVVVGRDGTFQRVEGVDEVLAPVKSMLEMQDEPPEMQELMLDMLRQVIVENARETWHQQVAGWKGVTLEPGKPLTRQGRLFPAAVLSVEVPVTETLTYEGPVPCKEGEADKRCVRLVLVARMEPSARPAVQKAFAEKLKLISKGESPELKVDKLEVGVRAELVTEPGSLVPHRFRSARRTLLVTLSPDNERLEDDQREEVESVYVYPSR